MPTSIPIDRAMVILFVCQGNTCRSVMAEAFAKKLFGDLAQIRSAGLSPQSKDDAQAAIECLRDDFDVDASSHVPRPVTQADLDAADVIVAMDKGIGRQLDWVPKRKLTVWKIDDPWRGEAIEYRRCGLAIKKQLGILADQVRRGGLGTSNPGLQPTPKSGRG